MSIAHDPDLIQHHLFKGERVLWSGQPKQGVTLGGRDALLIPFSLLWGGFVLFWNISVWSLPKTNGSSDWFFRLWGLPFLLAGAYFIVGRFIHDAIIRKRTHYAVTDQRVLSFGGRGSSKVASLDIHRLPKLQLSEHRDGTGTIELEGSSSLFGSSRNGFDYWVPALSSAVRLLYIEHPRAVYELIRNHSRA